MTPRVARLDAVVLSPADAGYLADALALFEGLARQVGSRPTAKLTALREELAAAARVSRSGGDASVSAGTVVVDPSSPHEYLDTTEAAAVLGCSPGNARDLARRGSVPAIRAGGRWLLESRAVHARAAGW